MVKVEVIKIYGHKPDDFVDIVKGKFQHIGHLVRKGVAKAVLEGGIQGRRGRGRSQVS